MHEHARCILYSSLSEIHNAYRASRRNLSMKCTLVFLTIVVCLSLKVSAGNNHYKEDYVPTKSFCGIYCVYAANKLLDKQVDFNDLLQTKYIGSYEGSSISELEQAASDHGLYTKTVEKLSSLDLQNCGHPVILHVKSDDISKTYDHYVLFLGMKNGRVRLFDPPKTITLLTFRELTPLWDGNGLIVSTEPINLSSIFAPTRNRFAMYAAAAIALILGLHFVKRWFPKAMLNSRGKLFGLSIGQGAVFAIVALLCGMLYHFANDAGLLANAHATASIQQAHTANFISKISERKVHKLLNDDTIFIDARFSRDYKTGHIKGAISLPVDANDIELQRATSNIAKDARIVTYCQSAGCKFAEKVAVKLLDDGFSNISIYKGGWAEWVAKNGKKEDAA